MAVTAAKRGNKATEVRIEAVRSATSSPRSRRAARCSRSTKVDVAADISGRIVRLAVKEGQMVTKGQFLLQIDPRSTRRRCSAPRRRCRRAKAQAAQAKANLLQAQRNYERSAEIQKTNAQLVSDEQIEQLKTQVEVNQALHRSGDAQRRAVGGVGCATRAAASRKTTILAPMSGRVTRLVVEQGETAVPGTFNKDAATLLTISDMSVLETKVKVDETDVARIAVGDSAVVQIDAFPDTTFIGRVVEISNSSVKARAAARVDRSGDRLRGHDPAAQPAAGDAPGLLGDGQGRDRHAQDALSIPIIALTVRENEELAGRRHGRSALGARRRRRKSASRTSRACSSSARTTK